MYSITFKKILIGVVSSIPVLLALLIILMPENATSGNESGKGWGLLGILYMLPIFLFLDAFLIRSIRLDKKAEKEKNQTKEKDPQ